MKKIIIAIVAITLNATSLHAQKIDINQVPALSESPVINIAEPKTFKLDNGLTVLFTENHKLPRAIIQLVIDNPPVSEGNKIGKHSLMAEMLGTGTKTLSRDDYNDQVDFFGSIKFQTNGAVVHTLSKYLPDAFSLFSSAMLSPKFTQEELDFAKDLKIENLKNDEKNASEVAKKAHQVLAYGPNSPYGEIETVKSLQSITLKDIEDTYRKIYIPNNAYMVVTGDVKFEEVKSLVEKYFSKWKKGAELKSDFVKSENPASTEINLINIPSAVQSVILVSNLFDLKMNDPAFFPVSLSNQILGGNTLTSRLNSNLREKNGFTYGAASSTNFDRYISSFVAQASVGNEVVPQALQEFLNEISQISQISEEELQSIKAVSKGGFVMEMESPEMGAFLTVNEIIEKLPEGFYKNYLKNIDNQTLQDVQAASKKYIHPDKLRIVIVGNTSKYAKELEKFGYPIKHFDSEGKPLKKTK